MGSKIGKDVKIFPSVDITFPWLLEIGDKSVIAWNVIIYNLGFVKIGTQTIISQNAHLCGGTHDITHPGFVLMRTGLTIGDKVWIAADAFIGPSVTVGDNSIVAARAVVIRDVDSQSLVGGNPAKFINKTVGYRGEA
jgi:putative colanic acid biosynthesis acetyltransferase WcaF